MSWIKASMKAAVTLVAAVFFCALAVCAVWAGPPVFDAWSAVRDAERDGRLDAETWQGGRVNHHVAHALLAAERRFGTSLVHTLSDRKRRGSAQGHLHRAAMQWMIDARYTRDQQLDDYARAAYFGRAAFGIDAAAVAWFGKAASSLSASEAAFLVSRLRAPSHPDVSPARRNRVLERMRALGYLSEEDARAAVAEPLVLAPAPT